MKPTLIIQNPAKPTQVKKLSFKSNSEAYQAAVSLEKVMLGDGMKNRHMPLIFVTNEDGTTLAMSNGHWSLGKTLDDGRVIQSSEKIDINVKVNTEIGETVRNKLPNWAFTWGQFLG